MANRKTSPSDEDPSTPLFGEEGVDPESLCKELKKGGGVWFVPHPNVQTKLMRQQRRHRSHSFARKRVGDL